MNSEKPIKRINEYLNLLQEETDKFQRVWVNWSAICAETQRQLSKMKEGIRK